MPIESEHFYVTAQTAPPSFKAVLFDLDGTLFSSLTDLGEAMDTVLADQGFPAHPIDAYRYFVGDGMKKLVTRDMVTANSAGRYAIGCLWGFREAAELRGSGARILLNHPTELLDFLEIPGDIHTNKKADPTGQ